MVETKGLNHLHLSVREMECSLRFDRGAFADARDTGGYLIELG